MSIFSKYSFDDLKIFTTTVVLTSAFSKLFLDSKNPLQQSVNVFALSILFYCCTAKIYNRLTGRVGHNKQQNKYTSIPRPILISRTPELVTTSQKSVKGELGIEQSARTTKQMTLKDQHQSPYDYELFINLGSGKSAQRLMNEGRTFDGMKPDQLGVIDLTKLQFRNGNDLDIGKIEKALLPNLKKITNKSIIYVVGHGSPGASQVVSDENVSLSIYDLLCLLAPIRGQVSEEEIPGERTQRLTIRLISCYAGSQHILGTESYGIQLAEALYFKKIRTRLFASPEPVPRTQNPERISIAQRYELPDEMEIFPVRPEPNSPVVFQVKPVKEMKAVNPLGKADIIELESFPFYYGYYREEEAEKMLKNCPEGAWLLRKSERQNEIVISIKRNVGIEHNPLESLGINLKKVLYQYGLNKVVILGLQEKIKQWEAKGKVLKSHDNPNTVVQSQPEGFWVVQRSNSTYYLFLKMDDAVHRILLEDILQLITEQDLGVIKNYIKSHTQDQAVFKAFGKEGISFLQKYAGYCEPTITRNANGDYRFAYEPRSGPYTSSTPLKVDISAATLNEWLANAKKKKD